MEKHVKIIIRAIDEASATLKNIGQEAGITRKQLGLIGAAGLAAGAATTYGLGKAVKTAADFESAIINAASVTGYAGKEFDEAKKKMAELARTLGKDTVFSAQEAAEAMYDLASKGFKPAEMAYADLLPYLNLATATQHDLKETTEIVTGTIRAYGYATSDAGKIADIFTKAIGSSAATMDKLGDSMKFIAFSARAVGTPMEELVSVLTQMYNVNLSGSVAATSMRAILARTAREAPKLVKGLKEYGLSIEDVNIEQLGFTKVLKNLADAQIGANDAILMFGQRLGPIVSIIGEVDAEGKTFVQRAQEMEDSLRSVGEESQRVADIQWQSLNNRMEDLLGDIEEVSITFGNTFIPVLKTVANALKFVVETFNKLPGPLKTAIAWLIAAGAAFAMVVGSAAILVALWPKIAAGWAAVNIVMSRSAAIMMTKMIPTFAMMTRAIWSQVAARIALLGAMGPLGWGMLAAGAAATAAAVYSFSKIGKAVKDYQYGGVVPGPIGEPVPIIAHGGERFLGVNGGGGGGGTTIININAGALMGNESDARAFARVLNKYLRDETRARTSGIAV